MNNDTLSFEGLFKRYQLLSDYSKDIFMFVRVADGKIIEANRAAVVGFGYDHQELLMLTLAELTDQNHNCALLCSDEEGMNWSNETVYRRKDGTVFSAEGCCQKAELDGERVFLQIIRDITIRKRAEEQSREQKCFVENLIQYSSVPTFVIDSDHKVLYWNKACEDLSNIMYMDIVGTNLQWKAFYDRERPCLADIVIDYATSQGSYYYNNFAKSSVLTGGVQSEGWYHFGGKARYMIFEAAPIYNHKGELIAAIETLRDYTDRKLSELELEQENSKILNELHMAASVQKELLPKEIPSCFLNISFAWEFLPSVFVAGDGLDVFQVDESHLGFFIFDVMGHGLTAALKSITINYMFKELRDGVLSPAQILNCINKKFCLQFKSWKFFTTFYGVLNTKTLQLTYARAGHCHPIVLSQKSGIGELKEGGPAIGFMEESRYKDYQLEIAQGDKLLIYTDGVIEAANVENLPYSKGRLFNCLDSYPKAPVSELIEIIRNDVREYQGSKENDDDMTLLGIEIIS